MSKIRYEYTLPQGCSTERTIDYPHGEDRFCNVADEIALAGLPEGTRIVARHHVSESSNRGSSRSREKYEPESDNLEAYLLFIGLPLFPIIIFNLMVQFIPHDLTRNVIVWSSRFVFVSMILSGVMTNLFNTRIPIMDDVARPAWSIYYDSWKRTDKFLEPKLHETSIGTFVDVVGHVFGAGPAFLDGFHEGAYGSNSVKLNK